MMVDFKDLENMGAEKDIEILKRENIIEDLKEKIAYLEFNKKEVLGKKSTVQNELLIENENLRDKNKKLMKDMSVERQRQERFKEQNFKLQAEIDSLKKGENSQDQNPSMYIAEIERVEGLLLSSERSKQELEEELQQVKKALELKSQNFEKETKTVFEKENQIKFIQRRLEECEGHLSSQKKENKHLIETVEELKNKLSKFTKFENENYQLKNNNEKYKKDCEQFSKDIEELKNTLKQEKNKAEKVNQKNLQISEQLSNANEMLTNMETDSKQKNTNEIQLNEQLSKEKTENSLLKNEIESLTEELKSTRKKLDSTSEQLKQKISEINNLETEQEELRIEKMEALSELNSLKDTLEDYKNSLRQSIKDKESLVQQLEEQENSYTYISHEKSGIETKTRSLEQENNILQDNLSEARKNLNRALNEKGELELTIRDLRSDLCQMTRKSNSHEEKLIQIERTVEDLQKINQKQSERELLTIQQLESHKIQLTEKEKEKQQLDFKIEEIGEFLETLEEEYKVVQNDLRESNIAIENLKNQIKQKESIIEDLKISTSEREETEKELTNLEKALTKSEQQLKKESQTAKVLAEKLKELVKEHDTCTPKFETQKTKIQNFEEKIIKLKFQLKQEQEEKDRLSIDNRKLIENMEALNIDLDDIEERRRTALQNVDKANKTIFNLQEKITFQEEKISEKDKTIHTLKEEIARLQVDDHHQTLTLELQKINNDKTEEITKLNSLLEEKKEQENQLSSAIDDLSLQKQRLEKKLEESDRELKEEVAHFNKLLQMREKKIEDLEGKLSEKTGEIESHIQRISELTKQNELSKELNYNYNRLSSPTKVIIETTTVTDYLENSNYLSSENRENRADSGPQTRTAEEEELRLKVQLLEEANSKLKRDLDSISMQLGNSQRTRTGTTGNTTLKNPKFENLQQKFDIQGRELERVSDELMKNQRIIKELKEEYKAIVSDLNYQRMETEERNSNLEDLITVNEKKIQKEKAQNSRVLMKLALAYAELERVHNFTFLEEY